MVLGLSYAAVPLYRIYCQKTGKGGQAVLEDDINEKVAALQKVPDRRLRIRFEAEKSARLAWDFKPSQTVITCSPGETVLAFYTARNHLDRPVNGKFVKACVLFLFPLTHNFFLLGIATYTILPYEAGKYFNKIQCFCFEEQQLNAEEEVDLPVFFYIDPEYSRDPYLFENEDIVLSYNFFETKEGYKLPKQPGTRVHLPSIDNQARLKQQSEVASVA